MLVIAAGVGLSEMLLKETVIRQTGDASVHTTTEVNAQATTSTAKTGVQPHQMAMHADGRGHPRILLDGIQPMRPADVTCAVKSSLTIQTRLFRTTDGACVIAAQETTRSVANRGQQEQMEIGNLHGQTKDAFQTEHQNEL